MTARPSSGMRALIWNRRDFRESSRIVTLVTRDEGKITALAKGAHRPNSTMLGRLDLLNLVEAKLAGRAPNLRLLSRVRVLHEPRGLRDPRRFLAASYVVELFDSALVEGRPDAALFDLLAGGVRLLERGPAPAVPTVLAGLELRFLEALGLLPPLTRCAACGRADRGLFLASAGRGFACAEHAPGSRSPVSHAARTWLADLHATPGRGWVEIPDDRARAPALAILGPWIAHAIERRPRLRTAALR